MPGRNGIPSVTEVLGVFTDFTRINPAVLAHACERGIRVHSAIAGHLQGLWTPPLDAEAQPYFDSFRKWADIMVESVVFVENEGICDCYGYMGHYDAALVLKGDDSRALSVLDWKTPVTIQKTWKAQNAAYCHLVEKHAGLDDSYRIHRTGSVMLSPDGKTAKIHENTHERTECFNAFIAALTAYKFFR
jgi:hypothetical protein